MVASFCLRCLLLALLVPLVRNEQVKWVQSYSTNESPVQGCARLSGNHYAISRDLTHSLVYCNQVVITFLH